MLKLGMKARDKVTRYEGTITAITHDLNSPDMFRLEAGKSETKWIDLSRIEPVDTSSSQATDGQAGKAGSSTDNTEEKIMRPPLGLLIAMAMSLGIPKVRSIEIVQEVLAEECPCPKCTSARADKKIH